MNYNWISRKRQNSEDVLRHKIAVLESNAETDKRRIEELENVIEGLKSTLAVADKKLRGDRVCDSYCSKCKYGISKTAFAGISPYTIYTCALDCKCKDFERSEE